MTVIDYFIFLQLTISASDQALPTPKSSTTQLIVNVPRDNTPPRFDEREFEVEISEGQAVNSRISEIRARDDNLKGQIKYEVQGVYPAPSFFNISVVEGVGRVYLIRDLSMDSLALSTYTVSKTVSLSVHIL